MADPRVEAQVLTVSQLDTRDWCAWNDLQPPGPPQFHVTGEVLVPNPGVHPVLVPKTPQGINPTILLLDLFLKQEPGIWPQIVVCMPARYDKTKGYYRQVQIYFGPKLIADFPPRTFIDRHHIDQIVDDVVPAIRAPAHPFRAKPENLLLAGSTWTGAGATIFELGR